MAAALCGSGCKKIQPEVAAVVVAWRQRKMEAAAKKEQVNNQLEIAVVAMVTVTVVVWRQTAVDHLCGSVKWTQLQKINQPEVAAAVVAWQQG